MIRIGQKEGANTSPHIKWITQTRRQNLAQKTRVIIWKKTRKEGGCLGFFSPERPVKYRLGSMKTSIYMPAGTQKETGPKEKLKSSVIKTETKGETILKSLAVLLSHHGLNLDKSPNLQMMLKVLLCKKRRPGILNSLTSPSLVIWSSSLDFLTVKPPISQKLTLVKLQTSTGVVLRSRLSSTLFRRTLSQRNAMFLKLFTTGENFALPKIHFYPKCYVRGMQKSFYQKQNNL